MPPPGPGPAPGPGPMPGPGPIPRPGPPRWPRGGTSSGSATPRSLARSCIRSWCSARIRSRSSSLFAARIFARCSAISSGVIRSRP
ncbi:MAG: hypothetical protein FJ108_11905 [Deltaproteobacteria bacterium]|nr:hypothetical protein [Deltaproteobacteria bacterium]